MNETAQAAANPALGILIFALGGLAGAVFTLPFKRVKQWAWESSWMVYALFGLVVVPWALAFAFSPNVLAVLKSTPAATMAYCYGCGAAWGLGGLTWGLMIRYLGVGLGLAIGCGLCSAAGTLIPPILNGSLQALTGTPSADATLVSVVVSLAGIIAVGLAGMSKERELSEEAKKKAVAEFNFRKGLIVAVFSGLMSSAMSFGLQGGAAIERLSRTTAPFTSATWRGLPVLVVVLAGGFTVNCFWCLFLNLKNKTFGDYVKPKVPLAGNLIFAGLAGAIWCSQFICFKTGEPTMGRTAYVGWAVLMASTILFSSLLGILLGEWKGTSRRTRALLAAGLTLLILSSALAGYSGYLSQARVAQVTIR